MLEEVDNLQSCLISEKSCRKRKMVLIIQEVGCVDAGSRITWLTASKPQTRRAWGDVSMTEIHPCTNISDVARKTAKGEALKYSVSVRLVLPSGSTLY
jgi:hypothetical protein